MHVFEFLEGRCRGRVGYGRIGVGGVGCGGGRVGG